VFQTEGRPERTGPGLHRDDGYVSPGNPSHTNAGGVLYQPPGSEDPEAVTAAIGILPYPTKIVP
jgi:hypothetical protein